MFNMPSACSCEDRPCCDCGQEYLAELRSFDAYGESFYDEMELWFYPEDDDV